MQQLWPVLIDVSSRLRQIVLGAIPLAGLATATDPGAPLSHFAFPHWVVGRSCEGLPVEVPTGPGTTMGTWAAASADAEAASVPAFRRLARELRAHGAPESLLRRARAAARDEFRHASLMTALARRFGAEPTARLTDAVCTVRPLEAVVLANASEGCVNETFAAAVALWQGGRARDPLVQSAMRVVALDEGRHAQLSWDLDAWAGTVLSPAARARVCEARQAAALHLGRDVSRPVDATLVREAGLPDAQTAAALARDAHRALWAA